MSRHPQISRTPRRAFTLIEVAIALVIFVVGALAIVRIFPGALGVVENSGQRATAGQLNTELLGRYDVDLGDRARTFAPDAVFVVDRTTFDYQNFAAAVEGRVTRTLSLPRQNLVDIENTALRDAQRIVGEGHRVQSAGGVNFILTQFPIDDSWPVRVYRKREIENVMIRDGNTGTEGTLDFSNASEPAPSDPTIPLYVSYRYLRGGVLNGVQDEPLLNSDTAVVLQEQDGGTNVNIVPGGIQAWYQQDVTPTLGNDDLGYISLTDAVAGEVVYVDYLVRTWNRILADRSFAPGNTGNNADRLLTIPVRPTRSAQLDLLIYGPNHAPDDVTVSAFDDPTVSDDFDKTSNSLPYDLDAAGVAPTDFDATKVRISQPTRDDWTRQISVAASTYLPYVDLTPRPNHPREPWREYVWDSSDSQTIYLPPSEAGKTLSVSYTYDAGGGNIVTANNEVVTVRDVWDTKAATATPPFPYATATYGDGSSVDARALATLQNPALSILSVRGLSVTARSAWINGDRYAHSLSTIYRAGGDS